ncbi:MAG TPA: hypothetical protein VN376_08830 [Longilinea sp.]|nr:hypothetical protein [Longilinea sp.]
MNTRAHAPWFFWPFAALWDFLAFILSLTGRIVAAVLGLALLIVGVILTALVITAPVGIPLAVFGLLLMVRSIF